MEISDLLKMGEEKCLRWLVENQSNFKIVEEERVHMYISVEEFEECVGYKVNSSFNDGFRMARLKM